MAVVNGRRVGHPHLYFVEGGTWRGCGGSGSIHGFGRIGEGILTSAEGWLSGPVIREGGAVGGGWSRRGLAAGRCGFVYRMTGEKRFGARALEILETLMGEAGWAGDFFGRGNPPSVEIKFHFADGGDVPGAGGLAYDMMAEEMGAEQRERFVRVCEERARWLIFCGSAGKG